MKGLIHLHRHIIYTDFGAYKIYKLWGIPIIWWTYSGEELRKNFSHLDNKSNS